METVDLDMLNFIDTYPTANFGENNKIAFIRNLDGFLFKNVDLNATCAYDIEDVDEEYGPREYSSVEILESLNCLNNEDNDIYMFVSSLRYAVNRYTNDVKLMVMNLRQLTIQI